MSHRRIQGHSPYEEVMGYCRAVVAGKHVYVAGTAPIPRDGSAPPEGAYEQTLLCLDLVSEALGRAGASLEDVVRTRIFLTDRAHFDDVARAHGDLMRDVRPVNTTVVTSLMDPAWKLEIEVEAVLP